MTILESCMWLYLIGVIVTALYFIRVVIVYRMAQDKWYLWVIDPIKAGLMWPIVVIQFLIWCKRNLK